MRLPLQRRMVVAFAVALCAVALPWPASAGADDSADENHDNKVRTGAYQITVPTRCKDSVIPTLIARLGWGTMEDVKKAGGDPDYDLKNETFEVYVPPKYDGTEPYGLLVWVNPGPQGAAPERWREVLDKHKVIWVGANNSGNNRSGWVRLGMALDAARHMPSAYNIDKDRIMVSGASGGGRCASMLDIAYPEVFTGGGIYLIGCNFYRIVEITPPSAGKPGTYYRKNFNKPKGQLWDLATKHRSHVFLTGDTDGNREQTEHYYNAAKKDGFKHATYIQVPGMGHSAPDAEWFEKALVALEEGRKAAAAGTPAVAKGRGPQSKPQSKPQSQPAAEKAVAGTAAARATPTTGRNTVTATVTAAPKGAKPGANRLDAPAAAAAEPAEPDEATKLMKLARLYVDNRLYSKAREKLKQLLKDHPRSPHAAEAKKLLSEIGSG